MAIVEKTPNHPPPRTGATRPTLTPEEEEAYEEVLAHFKNLEYIVPNAEEGKGALTDEEKFWLSKECILRYLRGSKWSRPGAIDRLNSTLSWRREFGIYDVMTPEYVEPEGVTGKELIFGYDNDGRPALYMLPSRQNTDGSTPEGQRKQLQYAIFMMERAFDLMGPDVESLCLMIDFADRAKQPSIGTARYMLSYLQDHYPERLGRAFLLNLPWYVVVFIKAVMPFIDPVTRPKMIWNPKVVEEGRFKADQCTLSWGGDVEFQFEHSTYWPALIKMCQERREEQMKRWRELGATVGISEWDLRQEKVQEKAVPEELTDAREELDAEAGESVQVAA